MADWDFDISNAPRGHSETVHRKGTKGETIAVEVFRPAKVILATKCGKVTKSQFLPDENRWEMLGKTEQPVAWQPWPKHPAEA